MGKMKLKNKNEFFVKYIGKSNTPFDKTYFIILSNPEFEKYNKGLDLHYELHFDIKNRYIRLDCHCRDYTSYSNLGKEDFISKVDDKILTIRNKLKNSFKKEFSDYRLKRYRYNYLCLIKKDIDLGKDIIEETEKFIEETYNKAMKIFQNIINV